jgi:hypothetical protein
MLWIFAACCTNGEIIFFQRAVKLNKVVNCVIVKGFM